MFLADKCETPTYFLSPASLADLRPADPLDLEDFIPHDELNTSYDSTPQRRTVIKERLNFFISDAVYCLNLFSQQCNY